MNNCPMTPACWGCRNGGRCKAKPRLSRRARVCTNRIMTRHGSVPCTKTMQCDECKGGTRVR